MTRITGVFDELTVELMAAAFDDACRRLPAAIELPDRDLVAKRILGTAALGERDPAKMRDDAIAYLEG